MQTITLCTSGVFSTVLNSGAAPMSMPICRRAARVSFSSSFLKAGSAQARATTVAPSAGERLSIRSTLAAISCGGEHALLDQQGADGFLQNLVGAGRPRIVILARRMRVVVIMIVVIMVVIVVVMVVHVHRHSYFSGSSQYSKMSASSWSPAGPS